MSQDERDRAKDEVEADIVILTTEIIPDLEEQLAWLTRTDYDPGQNPDHQCRDMDIEFLSDELEKENRDLRALLAV